MANPKVKLDLKERDLGLKKIMQEMQKLAKKPYVKIGVQGSLGEKPKKVKGAPPSKLSVVDVATVHEFGSSDGRIPERSFIRSTMNEKAEKFFGQAQSLHSGILSGKVSVERALETLGFSIVNEVKAKFQNNDWPDIKDPTRGGRQPEGDAKPLMDTRQMFNSITHKVEMDGKK